MPARPDQSDRHCAWPSVVSALLFTSLVSAGCGSAGSHLAPPDPSPATQPGAVTDPNRGCRLPAAQRTSDAGCWLTVEAPLGPLNSGPLFWHLYSYPTSAAAEAARGPRGTVAGSFEKHWLFTIEEEGWRPSGGERVAVIGPLAVERGTPYTARYMEAVFPPSFRSSALGHRHSGAEAWYVLTGAQCLETPDGPLVARAGEGAMVPAGPPMAISGVGPETRRSVLLVLHPTAEPWVTSVPDWSARGLCPD
jgi:quercetin dioxygenase-like cupin family protein